MGRGVRVDMNEEMKFLRIFKKKIGFGRVARSGGRVHGRLSPSAQHRVVYRKMCRRFPVVLQEIRK